MGVFARTSESENQDDKISNSFSFVLFFLFARCGFCWDHIFPLVLVRAYLRHPPFEFSLEFSGIF